MLVNLTMRRRFDVTDNPLGEALHAIVGLDPPVDLTGMVSCNELTDNDHNLLQTWAAWNARPSWSTGIGILDAANVIVREALDNRNIREQD